MNRPVLTNDPKIHSVPSGWCYAPIGTLASEQRERAGKTHKYPVLSVTKHQGIVRAKDYFKKAVHGRDTGNYKVVHPGDFAYATIHLDEGSIGLLNQDVAGIVSPMYTVFRPSTRTHGPYLFSALKLPDSLAVYQRLSEGTVNRRASIGFDNLANVSVLLPPLGEQRKIAAILSSVDEAIAATQAVIDQLGVVKKAMMAELLTRGLPGRHTRFKQTEIGEVPEEWEVVRLGDVAKFVTSGSRGWAQYYSITGARFIRSQNVRSGFLDLSDEAWSSPAFVDTFDVSQGTWSDSWRRGSDDRSRMSTRRTPFGSARRENGALRKSRKTSI